MCNRRTELRALVSPFFTYARASAARANAVRKRQRIRARLATVGRSAASASMHHRRSEWENSAAPVDRRPSRRRAAIATQGRIDLTSAARTKAAQEVWQPVVSRGLRRPASSADSRPGATGRNRCLPALRSPVGSTASEAAFRRRHGVARRDLAINSSRLQVARNCRRSPIQVAAPAHTRSAATARSGSTVFRSERSA
jgi:hypothetical protein